MDEMGFEREAGTGQWVIGAVASLELQNQNSSVTEPSFGTLGHFKKARKEEKGGSTLMHGCRR